MGYFNPFFQYGLEAFARDASDAGLDGLIVPDLPTEETKPLNDACDPYHIDVIPLLAPTSTDTRIKAACANAKGFVYCISLTGVTGARSQVSSNLSGLVNRIRKHTDLPILIGFGVSNRAHVKKMGMLADGVVVGSALINIISEAPEGQEVNEAIKFVEHLKGK
jgi:tryptophan synthase alpha subunit